MKHCDACQKNKASSKAYAGELQPVFIPLDDLIVKLPKTERGHDSILVFVDRLSKMAHLVPTVEALSATAFEQLFRLDHEIAWNA